MKDYTITEIESNIWNDGFYAYFKVDDKEYYADIAYLPFPVNTSACTIFHSKNKEVTDWTEIYCKMNIPVDKQSFEKCIKEFVDSL